MDVPVSRSTGYDAEFWRAAGEGRLVLQRVRATGEYRHPPRGRGALAAEEIEWVPAQGGGVLESFSVVHRSFYPAIPAPYVFAIVRLDEGVQLTAHLVDCPVDAARVGMPVEVCFRAIGDNPAMPCVRPAGGA